MLQGYRVDAQRKSIEALKLQYHNSWLTVISRAVHELLGKNICSVLPANRESVTLPARKDVFAWLIKRRWKKKCPWSTAYGRRRKKLISQEKQKREIFNTSIIFTIITLFYVPQEESVLRKELKRTAVVDCSRHLEPLHSYMQNDWVAMCLTWCAHSVAHSVSSAESVFWSRIVRTLVSANKTCSSESKVWVVRQQTRPSPQIYHWIKM